MQKRLSSNVLSPCLILFSILGGRTDGPSRLQGPAHKISLAEMRRYLGALEKQIKSSLAWQTLDGRSVSLHYVGLDETTVKSYLSRMDLAVASDCQVLHLPLPSEKIPLFMYPDSKTLSSALGQPGSFNSGVSLGSWAVMVAHKNFSLAEVGSGAAHELGHAILHEDVGLFGCAFMAEGIANYCEARFDHATWLKGPRPLEKTPVEFLLDKASTTQDFNQGARFCAFLMSLDKNNPTRIKNLLRELNKGRVDDLRGVGAGPWIARANSAFKKVYGKSPEQLDSDWRATFRG